MELAWPCPSTAERIRGSSESISHFGAFLASGSSVSALSWPRACDDRRCALGGTHVIITFRSAEVRGSLRPGHRSRTHNYLAFGGVMRLCAQRSRLVLSALALDVLHPGLSLTNSPSSLYRPPTSATYRAGLTASCPHVLICMFLLLTITHAHVLTCNHRGISGCVGSSPRPWL
jgi:hypothetical protein